MALNLLSPVAHQPLRIQSIRAENCLSIFPPKHSSGARSDFLPSRAVLAPLHGLGFPLPRALCRSSAYFRGNVTNRAQDPGSHFSALSSQHSSRSGQLVSTSSLSRICPDSTVATSHHSHDQLSGRRGRQPIRSWSKWGAKVLAGAEKVKPLPTRKSGHQPHGQRQTESPLQSVLPQLLSSICAVVASVPLILGASPAFAEAGVPTSGMETPYSQSEQAKELGLVEGRIRPCPTAFNPNCVSTSSLNQCYGEPWIIPPSSTQSAMRKIENAIMTTVKGAQILETSQGDTGYYILAEADGLFGRDTLEFLVKEEDGLVLYRSMAGKVVYIYPFTTPITDLDAQRKRMKGLEEELGWAQVAGACDYGVCSVYEDAEEEDTIRREPRLLPLGFDF